MKKIYLKSLLTALLLLCSSVASAQSFESNGISYSILSLSDRTVEVAHNANYQGFIIIPSTADYSGISFKVTGIGNRAFSGTKVTEMLISEGVTHIGDSAFYNSSLKEIIIPNSVTAIENYTFLDCYSLTSIEIPDSVTTIGNYAFHGCYSLTSIEIPDSVTTIGNSAFYYCAGLTSVTIPNSVTSIGYSAFYNCAGLTSVTIGSGVTSIGTSAFSNCNKLTAVHITDLAAWCNIDFGNAISNPLYYAKNLYLKGEKVTNLVIPIGVKKIKSYAFYNCTGLTSVTIPNSVTSIGDDAFYYCSSLTAVHIIDLAAWCNIDFGNAISNPLYYARNLYLNGELLTDLVIPNGIKEIKSYAFSYCQGLKSVTIPNSVTTIGNNAFYGCYYLTSITIPNSVTSIGGSAFSYCQGLTSVTIPNSVISIGSSAFRYCTGLTSVEFNADNCTSMGSSSYPVFDGCNNLSTITIGENVKTIPSYAFYGCTGLTSITIPNSVTSIGNEAFYGCTSLTSVEFNAENCTSMGSSSYPFVFSGCTNLSTITIGENVKTIPSYAFYGCTGLTSVEFNAENCTSMGSSSFGGYYNLSTITIGENVKTIPSYAFYNCIGLTSVTIPNSVTTIGDHAFSYCQGLTSVTIPNSVTTIGDGTFYECTSLTSLTIPNSVTSIGDYAFNECESLTSITIPNSVTSIGSNAFHNTAWYNNQPDGVVYAGKVLYDYKGTMPENTSITIKEGTLGIADDAFFYCKSLKSVTIPNSVTTIGDDAFYYCSSLTAVHITDLSAWCKIDFYNNYSNPLDYANNLYLNGNKVTNLIIPNDIKEIKNYAFYNCTGLTSVAIPNSVTTIGDDAFNGCSGLTEIYVKATTPPTIKNNTFVEYTAALYVPIGTKAAYQTADYWKNFTNIMEMDFAIKGDITGDESVDVSDLTTLVNMILDSSLSTDAADITGDGSVDVSDLTSLVSIILGTDEGSDEENNDTPTTDSRAVDLGLSVKWASCNVGATAPEEYGGYYAWGETEEKSNYSWSTYKYCNGSYDSMTKYCINSSYGIVDNKTTLEASDDVATVKWGGAWRMPTRAEQDELRNNCTWQWTTLNSVNGYRVTGPNGNSIFLSAAGYRYGAEVGNRGSEGYYWSSRSLSISFSGNYASSLYFYSDNCEWKGFNRCDGRTVRPVCP